MAAHDPIPVRFFDTEENFLHAANSSTGVPIVELVRRGVRLMQRQQQLCRSYDFLLGLPREQNQKG